MADYDAQPGRKPPAERERSRAQMEADEVDLHARLWRASDCEFARDTIEIAAAFIDGGTVGLATELRNREKVLGTTIDSRRDLRIRYTEPASSPPAGVTNLDQYRDL
jgi:hypothetical protein